MNYDIFKNACVEELKVLQDKLRSDHDINWYADWYYDQATGLLTLTTDDTEINFRYFRAGTFSRNTGTWMWAWNNEYTLANIKDPALAIRAFGQEHHFGELTTGLFPADEKEAWALTAIAANLQKGIGAYRAVHEHLLIFMVLTEVVDNEKAQAIKDKFVSCDVHDTGRIAFICRHLNNETKTGFEEAFETSPGMELEEDEDFGAWCDACETVRKREGEWNDKAMEFASLRIVCEECYFEIKELNLGYR